MHRSREAGRFQMDNHSSRPGDCGRYAARTLGVGLRFKTLHLLALITFVSIGFAVYWLDPFVADWRQGDGVCAVHSLKMGTVIVHVLTGSIQMAPEYYDAKERDFPNCGVEYPRQMFGKERGKIFVCPACEKSRRKWGND